jgi:hypothetical protein
MVRMAVLMLLLSAGACSDPPISPGPINPPPPPPPPPPTNTAPVIDSIALSGDRTEVDTNVTVTATVRDAETPADQLRFEWQADVGTFSGEGASVRWQAPRGSMTPVDLVLRLTVRETYGVADANGVRPQHVVTGSSPPVRLHDSQKEVSDLAMIFLQDFSNSSIAPAVTVRNFTDSCSGKQAELDDVVKNREHYQILSSKYSVQSVSFSGQWSRGNVAAPCEFTSRVVKCHPEIPDCFVGKIVFAAATCALETRYESRRWWLCDSRFVNPRLNPQGFFFGR